MAETESKALQAKEKSEVAGPIEQTRPGRVYKPAVDIVETDEEIIVLADMPGVKAEHINIDLRENVLSLDGEVERPEKTGETDVFREYHTGKYQRQFSLSQIIDQSDIEAELTDGVLRIRLPKIEKATPRKITVKT